MKKLKINARPHSSIVCLFVVWIICATTIFVTAENESSSFSFQESQVEEQRSTVESIEIVESILPPRASAPLIQTFEYDSAPTVEEEPEAITNDVKYYDVPLDATLQEYIVNISKKYNVDPTIVIAMIRRESSYRDWVVGDNGRSYGLMQIQPRWHYDRMRELNCVDLLDPYQNIIVGVDFLSELMSSGKPIEWCLMAYNGGPSYADRQSKRGIVSDYATGILEHSAYLKTSN